MDERFAEKVKQWLKESNEEIKPNFWEGVVVCTLVCAGYYFFIL